MVGVGRLFLMCVFWSKGHFIMDRGRGYRTGEKLEKVRKCCIMKCQIQMLCKIAFRQGEMQIRGDSPHPKCTYEFENCTFGLYLIEYL